MANDVHNEQMTSHPESEDILAELRSIGAGSGDIVGMVESIGESEITGWAFSRSGKTVHIALQLADETLPVEVSWIPRPEVCMAFGLGDWVTGFSVPLTRPLAQRIRKSMRGGSLVEVAASGIVLPRAAGALRRRQVKVGISVEEVSQFSIYGLCADHVGGAEALRLYCNGELVDCTVLYIERHDIDGAEGFEVDIPGYIWTQKGAEDRCLLELRADEQVSEPVTLTHKDVIRWVSESVALPEGHRRQHGMLTAIEHLRYCGALRQLDQELQDQLLGFARAMQLGAFLTDVEQAHETEGVSQRREESGTLILWKALRALNARVLQQGGAVLPHVKSVLQTLRGSIEAREYFLRASVPLLCSTDEFAQVREITDLSALQSLESRDDPALLSMAAAALAVEGRLVRTADVMSRMSKSISKGWLWTECVKFAVVHVARLEAEGEASFNDAEKVRYAFVGLLDSFSGDWFSRLHDHCLVDAMLEIIAHVDRYTDYHRKDMVHAAIRHYGLNPVFWERWNKRASHAPIPELELARDEWRALMRAMESNSVNPSDRLQAFAAGIRFFRTYRNPDALVFLREVVVQALPALNEAMMTPGRQLIEDLIDGEWREMLRIAAAPIGKRNAVTGAVRGMESRLLHVIREMTPRARSLFYGVQIEAAQCLARCRQAASSEPERLAALLSELESHAVGLANWEGAYLATDLLASGYALAVESGMEGERLLVRLESIIRRVLGEVNADWHLPSSVQAALHRLGSMPDDPILAAFLHEVTQLSREKFGPSWLPTVPDRPLLQMADAGWPCDTLVVIYSCRKYLETRVRAIRDTWVQDLKQRGIPYVVVVGSGDDTLEGDVLALNVSDLYEDLPKKTLKLFDWVYKNTDAQYVLKIDDDCYLDVEHYFDTLSYRKYDYYGRVIRRAVGGTDRTWHQKKSHSMHGQKGIDKSPDPSVYADGGGGYCLSRTGIEKLLGAAQTAEGRRLAACSFMEDKLVGDLLAKSKIVPFNEDYESYQRRRTFAEAIPVGMYENTFFASPLSPTKVVHLDTEHDLAVVRTRSKDQELWPKKIWPTCWSPSIGVNSNQLELLSDAGTALRAADAPVIVVAVVRNEMIMLPHFLDHYRKLGASCFAIVDNCSDDGSREYLLQQKDVVLYSADTEYKHSHYGVAWQQAVLGNLCLGKWVIVADADEFLVYEGCETRSIERLVADLEAEGATGVRVDMIDMYPFGELGDADFGKQVPFDAAPWFDRNPVSPWLLSGGFYSNSKTVVSNLRHRLINVAVPNAFTSQKYALLRYQPWVRLSEGLHDAAGLRVSAVPASFAHFKYHADFAEKVRTEIRRAQHFKGAEEYRRYAAMMKEVSGGFGKHGLSIRYEGSQSFSNPVAPKCSV